MNQRNLWTTLGLSALSIALIALPGSSKQKQEPGNPAPAAPSSSQKNLQVYTVVDGPQAPEAMVQELDEPQAGADGNLQYFMGSGGGWLGVGVSEVSSAKAKSLKLPEERGAILGRIVPDSPAAKAGLKENDVVMEINGQRIEGTEQFRRMIREIPAGRTANLTVWRDARSQNIKVTVGKPEMSNMKVLSDGPKSFAFSMPELPAMPDLSGLERLRTFALVSPGHPLLGIDAESLSGDFGNYFGALDGEGVLVRGVFANSAAAIAGLKVGDVITSLNGERIRSASELREKLLTRHQEKAIQLAVLRNKIAMTLSVELPQREEHEEHFSSERTNI